MLYSSLIENSSNFDARPSFWAELSTYVQRAFVKPSSSRPTCSPKLRKNPLECPTQAVGWCGHAAYAAHPLASVRHRSWLVTVEWFMLESACISPHNSSFQCSMGKSQGKMNFLFDKLLYCIIRENQNFRETRHCTLKRIWKATCLGQEKVYHLISLNSSSNCFDREKFK